jgi:sialate O-acetylesterase
MLLSVMMALGTRMNVTTAGGPLLSPLFTDNMVLQRNVSAPVWGWAEPGTRIKVEVAGKSASAIADASGKWLAKLPALPVGGPYTLHLTGPTTIDLKNILVGDVWICSGQSNMEMGIGAVHNGAQEIASADYPQIRLLTVQKKVSLSPQDTFSGHWDVCTPQTVSAGGWAGFSAVGYFFGRELQAHLKVPIGLIHTSWGGTPAEAWTSAEALRKLPDFTARVAQVEEARALAAKGQLDYEHQLDQWWSDNDPGTKQGWDRPEADVSAWKTMTLPTAWEKAGLPDFDGTVWFRREVTVPDSSVGKEAILHLGPIDDMDTTYVNGVRVGGLNTYDVDRSYKLSVGTLKSGKNIITVRVLDTGGAGGIYGKPEQMSLECGDGSQIPLNGDWQYSVSAELKQLRPPPINHAANDPNVSTVLYNGMVAPLIPFAIRGAIWYQGETNAGRAFQYRSLLPAMIRDWRDRFGVGEFPFLIVQLANWQARQTVPGDDAWAELREAQALTAKTVGHSAIAVITDLGDAGDIHPKDKQDVGKRLALQALVVAYGEKHLVSSGPVYKEMKKTGNILHLTFDSNGGGLVTKDGANLEGFAIAGADRKWVWGEARIVGNEVQVSSPSVPDPVAVRYAWHINPLGNLYNKEGLPAGPFRTDDWPGITMNNH